MAYFSVILYAVTAVYFAGVMVRLMLTLTPVVCVLSGIAFSYTYEVDHHHRQRERYFLFWSHILTICSVIILSYLKLDFNERPQLFVNLHDGICLQRYLVDEGESKETPTAVDGKRGSKKDDEITTDDQDARNRQLYDKVCRSFRC